MCPFTVTATLSGTIAGNVIQGQLIYSEVTNGNPTCGYHSTCTTSEAFTGVRAPSPDGG